ncbi:hypothetical protein V6C53_01625 [Desulfocurvibacter africanus]|uniref:hypothetical protein n=1 Tax=Desulfocurvibacter africanus TaxID=873 RepID=UPI002FD942FC
MQFHVFSPQISTCLFPDLSHDLFEGLAHEVQAIQAANLRHQLKFTHDQSLRDHVQAQNISMDKMADSHTGQMAHNKCLAAEQGMPVGLQDAASGSAQISGSKSLMVMEHSLLASPTTCYQLATLR